MRLYQKLVLFMLAVTLLPVSAVGFSLLRGAEDELKARIGAQQAAAAASAAQLAGRELEGAVELLVRSAEPFRWPELSPQERAGALQLLFEGSALFSAAGLLDAQGRELAPTVIEGARGSAHDALLRPEELRAFKAALPLADLEGQGAGAVAMSALYARPRVGASAAAVALALDAGEERWFVAAEISLATLQRQAEALSEGGAGRLFLLDGQGRVVAGPDRQRLLEQVPEADRAAARAAGERPVFTRYLLDGEPVLAAAARAPGALGWTALIRIPEREAFASVARMRRTVLLWLGGALALLLLAGLVFSRGLARGIEQVAEGARAYARGELDRRIAVGGADEVAELAETFNSMGAELGAARRRLETWNEELQQKVEERTAELKAAQAQLIESQKLAAVGQLGAGVAHEINNPLAGILGHTQLLMIERPPDDPLVPALRKIETQAKRAREITSNLLRFSQHRASSEMRETDVNRVVADALSLVENQIRADGIALEVSLAESLPGIQGDQQQLSQVVLHLVANARTAMAKSEAKRLTVRTGSRDGQVFLEVRDTGKGIAESDRSRLFEPFFSTKDVWTNVGLGLSVSYRIVTEHGGRFHVDSQVGEGSSFTIELPQVGSRDAQVG